jgi:crossover junction endodeoxyribonuclease RuvC
MNVLGVDPGATGALALVDIERCRLVDVLDMPVIRAGKTMWVDGAAVLDWLESREVELAVIEQVNGFPGMGLAQTFGLGRMAGGIETALSSAGFPMQHVTPQVWKKRAGLIGQEKKQALVLAKARLRSPPGAFDRAKDIGRADAALIALFGIQASPRKAA